MGWAYSVDLRERVVAAFDRDGMTDQEAAALFKIGEATVRRWKRLKRETGALVRRPGGGGNPPRVAADQYVVRAIVEEKPDLTDQEVAWEFHRRTGRGVSRSSMNRVLLKMALTRKKEPHRGRAVRAPDPGPPAQVHRACEGPRPEPARLHRRGGQPHRDDSGVRPRATR